MPKLISAMYFYSPLKTPFCQETEKKHLSFSLFIPIILPIEDWIEAIFQAATDVLIKKH